MVTNALVILGLVGILAGGVAARAVRLHIHRASLRWWRVQRVPILVGALCAAILSGATYSMNASTRIVGIPFPAAAFEKHGDVWMDFVGAMTLPLLLANAAFFLLVPQIPVLLWLRTRARREARQKNLHT